MRRCSSPEVGSYVLELAGVIMGVAVFIVGAADITRIFQARSAVRAAVNDGARCIFPTDAACAKRTQRGVSSWSPSFDVWVWGAGYEVPQESFVVSARWQQEPVYEVPVLKDEIAGVTLEQQPFQYRPYSMRYPVSAHTTYLMQTRYLPVVVGGRPLAPQFADPFTNKISRPSATYGLGTVSGSTTKGGASALKNAYGDAFKIGSVSFSVRDAWPTMEGDAAQIEQLPAQIASSLPCFFGVQQQSPVGGTLNWSAGTPQECRYRIRSTGSSTVIDRGALKVPMMFRVEGDSRGTVEDAVGKVMMALSWQSRSAGGGRVELGGRAIGYWGSGNFIPRGLAEDDINPGLRSQYADYGRELSLYYELPLLPVDASVTLDFYLVSFNNRRVAWNGGKLELWLPQYRFVHEQKECGYASDSTICSQPPAYAPVHYLSLTDGAPFSAETIGADTCSIDEDPSAEGDLSAMLARVRGEALRGGNARPYAFKLKVPANRSICAPRLSHQSCAAQLPEYYEGCGTRISLDEIASRCGLRGASTKAIEYTTRALSRSTKRVRGCSDAPLPQCAVSNARKVESALYSGAGVCEVSAISTVPQMVIGPLDATTCQDREGEIEDLYRSREKIPVGVPISLIRLPASSRFSAEPPVNSCVPYRAAGGRSGEMICGRGLSKAAAERCCAASEGRCRKQRVDPPSDPEADNSRNEILSAAQQRVVEAVQAGYPPARHQSVCGEGEVDCLEVATVLEDDDSKAVVSAKVHVPLMVLRPFAKNWTTVAHSTTRELERS